MPSTVSFFLLAAGLSLFLLLGLAGSAGNICVAGELDSKSADVVLKVVFFLPAAGPPLLKSPVLLELSSLSKP